MRLRFRVLLTCMLAAMLLPSLTAQELKPPSLNYSSDFFSADFERSIDFRKRRSDDVMSLPGVEGTAIRANNGRSQLIVYVNKAAYSSFDLKDFLEEAGRRGISAEVVPVGEFRALQVQMGTSTGGSRTCASGTLGMAVRRGAQRGYLTAAHVAAVEDLQLVCPNGPLQDQVAPGRGDRNCGMSNTIGRLIAATTIPDDGVAVGEVDAAFVEASPAAVDERNACGVCPSDLTVLDPRQAAASKLAVRSCGRGDQVGRSGRVTEFKAEVWIRYKCVGRVKFRDQLMVDGIAAPDGYSGAVAFGADGGIVGLIIAGDGVLTAVTPMRAVFEGLGGLAPLPCR